MVLHDDDVYYDIGEIILLFLRWKWGAHEAERM